ncbi:DUF493 family protein [Croceivirga thetidis]|uniref:DUF493 domain-containing protein n=1 Tax=Croceivirga thetidis TaxID=2721623 RepID=A0ABX1GSS9_9FLAO|nr:DUF493 family protein [Croceivirga thetidis]NKI32061.1 DUF493 domain-containing protein [Croceivirga thetidis]
MDPKDPDEFYARLRDQLLEDTKWPSDYLYKFIIPTDDEKSAQINKIFDNTGAVIQSKKSKNGKYTSISVNVRMNGPEDVIAKYKEVSKVEGVISL